MRSASRHSSRGIERAARVVLNLGAVVGLTVVSAVVVALLFGVRPVVFVSGSMGPQIETGALALTVPVDAQDIRPGQVISAIRDDGVRVTHRALATEQAEGRWRLSMQGDGNPAPDQDTYDVTGGADRVVWHLNGVGRLFTTTKVPLFAAAAALLVLAAVPGRRGAPTVTTRTTVPAALGAEDAR